MDSSEPVAPPPPRRVGDPEPEGFDLPDLPPAQPAPRVVSGAILAYWQYDIAEEIDLAQAEALLQSEASRLRLARENSQYVELRNPPVSLSLGPRQIELAGVGFTADLRVKLFDFGAVSFVLRVPLQPGLAFEDLVRLSDLIYDSPAIGSLCRAEAKQLMERVRPSLQEPQLWDGDESYTIIWLTELEGDPTANEVMARCDLARLILGEPPSASLSRQQRADVLRHTHSYLTTDLAVVDWNSAFVYEPSASMDIPEILEIANAQLMELRFYDWLLDRELDVIYDAVNVPRPPWWSIFSSKYGRLRRRTLALLMDLGEFTERVDNALKIIGDFYLARVYSTAVSRFRISDWQQDVYRKQNLVANVYSLLKSEVDTDRLLWLEITVVVLILGELLLALHVV